MEHAWCHDIARDAAVRADEDGRTGPLPTLGEAIARPFADAAKCSVPVSKTGEGQSGLRTERLTLDITSAHDERLADCIVESIGDCLLHGESVRVVDEDREAADRVSREEGYRVLLAEVLAAREDRDAAIRERDCEKQRADRDSVKCSALADKVISLRARVAELEARTLTPGEGSCAAQAASGGGKGEPVAWGVRRSDGTWWPSCRSTRDGMLSVITGNDENIVVLPLYRSPPQPRGWLTQDERLALDAARTIIDGSGRTNIGATIEAILGRSSPPEVVLPEIAWRDTQGVPCVRLVEVRWALAAAGVAVKEVERE
jgi:hypothetical protein